MKISVYNILGSLQAELLNGTLEPGRHSINWDASKKSSGIYFIELKTDQFREIKKVTLIVFSLLKITLIQKNLCYLEMIIQNLLNFF